jgi:hypothetical protein
MCTFGFSMLQQSLGKENRFCEGTDHLKAALSNGMTSLQVVVASARSVIWGEQ